jgi:hypothetical protein
VCGMPACFLCLGFNQLTKHFKRDRGICVTSSDRSLLASLSISTGQDVSSPWALFLLAHGFCLLVLGSLIQASWEHMSGMQFDRRHDNLVLRSEE